MSDNIETPTKSKTPRKQKKEPKPDRYNGFKVPPKVDLSSTSCTNHIYSIIKEAAPVLLDRDDVRTAFNNFVDCLSKYDDVIESWIPCSWNKYHSGINIKCDSTNPCDKICYINCRFDTGNSDYEYGRLNLNEIANDILNTYKPLYDLIKRDVVPYMEIKHWEIENKSRINCYIRLIKNKEKKIKELQDKIEFYAKELVALQTPKSVTKFD
jgi:hypothetical protein